MRFFMLTLSFSCLVIHHMSGENLRGGSQNAPAKISSNNTYGAFLINNVFNYYGNNGDGSFNPASTDNEGFEFLKGGGKHIIFEDGVVWGGYHKGRATPKVGGSVYRHGLQAGPILVYGTPSSNPVAGDPADPSSRIYRVRPDIHPGVDFSGVQATLEAEEVSFLARYGSVTAQEVYDQYIRDWNEWPASLGAPYMDVDNNGAYDPAIDIPGKPGAGQTLWYVANDCDSARTAFLAGSPVIGLEMQKTIWGYKSSGAIGQAIFVSTVLTNKSGAQVDSMYLVQWADPDLGDGSDDFVGCDTVRNLGYVYNGKAVDAIYGSGVPAGGFVLLQGPMIPSPGDTAIFQSKKRAGFKNLGMSAFVIFSQGIAALTDPRQGANGDIDWSNLMRGRTAATGSLFIDPTTGQATKFCLSGDPVVATDGSAGWVDGTNGLVPADRRMCLVTGPFAMAAGATQELVVATLAGRGSDRISSISTLRSVSDQVRAAYRDMVTTDVKPDDHKTVARTFTLQQNYPNPCNPNSEIRYQISEFRKVKLSVYDMLGREVLVLVNENKAPGMYQVTFDGSGLASGVYLYRLQSGAYVQTRKLLLVR